MISKFYEIVKCCVGIYVSGMPATTCKSQLDKLELFSSQAYIGPILAASVQTLHLLNSDMPSSQVAPAIDASVNIRV